MTTIQFTVEGKPAPAGSKRGFVRGKHAVIVDANPNAGVWKQQVAQAAREAYGGELLTGPLLVEMAFRMVRPKSHYGTGKVSAVRVKPTAPVHPTGKPDVLKLTRAVEDALTGVIYRDDSQIVSEQIAKCYGSTAGVTVTVTAI